MKRVVALIVGVAFAAGMTGVALAQTPTTPKEEKKSTGTTEKPAAAKSTALSANGTVKTAAADNVVVAGKGKDGKPAEWTFAVDPKTKIRKNGKDITAADLAAGDGVYVRYHDDAGKAVADSVTVRAAKKAAAKTEGATTPAPKTDAAAKAPEKK